MSATGDLFATPSDSHAPVQVPNREERRLGPVFFAVKPDAGGGASAAGIVDRVRAAHGLTGTSIAPERLHVTLLLVGDFAALSSMAVDAACNAAAAIDLRAFEITFDHVQTFNTGRPKNPFVLTARDNPPGVAMLRHALIVEMKRRGTPYVKVPRYTPHMTLLYDCLSIQPQFVEPVRWIARELVLIHSHVGYSRHVTLASWRLRS